MGWLSGKRIKEGVKYMFIVESEKPMRTSLTVRSLTIHSFGRTTSSTTSTKKRIRRHATLA